MQYKFIYKLNSAQLERMKIALNWLKSTQESNFYMASWFIFTNGMVPLEYFNEVDLENEDVGGYYLPVCDTCGCFSGTINHNLATNVEYKKVFSDILRQHDLNSFTLHKVLAQQCVSASFLQLPPEIAEIIFVSSSFYVENEELLENVSKSMVEDRISEVLVDGYIEYIHDPVDEIDLKHLLDLDGFIENFSVIKI
jgi:hypothetical protein